MFPPDYFEFKFKCARIYKYFTDANNQNYSDYQQMIFYRVTVWGRALSNMGNSATYSHSKIYINNTPPTKEGGGGFAYSVVGLGGV